MAWQDISTAPKDGTTIDVVGDEGVERVWWSDLGCWMDLTGTYAVNEYPTHWMPLPSPPAP